MPGTSQKANSIVYEPLLSQLWVRILRDDVPIVDIFYNITIDMPEILFIANIQKHLNV